MRRTAIKKISAILFCALSLSACSAKHIDSTLPKDDSYFLPKDLPHKKVIIDTDAGADDCAAIILAAKSRNLDILGVTTLAGNVSLEQSAENVLMALETAGSDAPVYKGAAAHYDGTRIDACSVFGTDGMGDAGLIHPVRKAEEKDAVDFILDSVRANPGEVELVALGPTTNIANAIKKDPDTMKRVKMIWSMGTAGLREGNASPVAEFNVYLDAPAYKTMLDSDIPLTIISLEVCGGDAMWTDEHFKILSKGNEACRFIVTSFGKIREFYKDNGEESVKNCDTMAMSCVIDPGFIKDSVKTHASCITEPGECYGQVIFYKEGFVYDIVKNDLPCNVTLVTEINDSHDFDMFSSIVYYEQNK